MTDTTQPPAETLARLQEAIEETDRLGGLALVQPDDLRAVLAALSHCAGGDAIPAGEESETLTGPQLNSVLDAMNFVLAGEFDKNVFPHGEAVMERACNKLSGLKGRTVRASATPKPPAGGECPSSPDSRHQVDTSMESGPNNCFHCEAPMGGSNAR